jgi:MFS superfamily sulfate permease-like transporter
VKKDLYNRDGIELRQLIRDASFMSNPVAPATPNLHPLGALPKGRIAGLKENWKHDIVSGFILFLIAMPLSLGIAGASGMPPMAGIFAAIICTTTITALLTDLLIGVAAGVAVKFLLHIFRGVPVDQLFSPSVTVTAEGDGTVKVSIAKAAVFSNYLAIKKSLDKIEPGKNIVFDLSRATFIDHTVMEHLHDFQRNYKNAGGSCEITGLELHKASGHHPTACRRLINQAVTTAVK